jgi:hypothetical protein
MTELNELFAALATAQGNFETLYKDNTADTGVYKYRYIDLATVVEKTRAILTAQGLSVAQFPTMSAEGKPTLTTYLAHSSGQHIAHEMPLFLPKNDPQGQGSAITYARRYAYCAVLGIVADEDDDGKRAKDAVQAETEEERHLRQVADELYRVAMQRASELKHFEGDGEYTQKLREMAAIEGHGTVSAWAKADPNAVRAAIDEYFEIVSELKNQASAEAPAAEKPVRRRRAKVGEALDEKAREIIEAFPGTEDVSDARTD